MQGRKQREPETVPETSLILSTRQPGQCFAFRFLQRKPRCRDGKCEVKAPPYPKRLGIVSAPGKMAVV